MIPYWKHSAFSSLSRHRFFSRESLYCVSAWMLVDVTSVIIAVSVLSLFLSRSLVVRWFCLWLFLGSSRFKAWHMHSSLWSSLTRGHSSRVGCQVLLCSSSFVSTCMAKKRGDIVWRQRAVAFAAAGKMSTAQHRVFGGLPLLLSHCSNPQRSMKF